MADATPTTSRRAMLGVLAAVPLAAAVPALALPITGDRTAWDRAMASYEVIRRAQGEAEATFYALSSSDPDGPALAQTLDGLCSRLIDAETVLLKLPAPDARALLWKIEFLLRDMDGQTDAFDISYVTPAVEDARRLLGGVA